MERVELLAFLNGSKEEKESFLNEHNFGIRGLQWADEPMTINGQTYVPVHCAADDTYVSRDRQILKKCPHCGQLKPADQFVTLPLLREDWTRPDRPRARWTKTVTVCSDCAADESYIRHVYRAFNTEYNIRTYRLPTEGYAFANGNLEMMPAVDRHGATVWLGSNGINYAGVGSVLYTKKADLEDGGFTTDSWKVLACPSRESEEEPYSFRNKFITVEDTTDGVFNCFPEKTVMISYNRFYGCDSDDTRAAEVPVYDKFVNEHPELFVTCPNCGRIYLAEEADKFLVNGGCKQCQMMTIYRYHGWNGRFEKLLAEDDDPKEKLFMGVEIETEGDEENRRFVSPISDLFHLEHDGSLGEGSFEMVSQPMSWKRWLKEYPRIASVLKNLSDNGQHSHDSGVCGLHIHINGDAFKSSKAVDRFVALINFFKKNNEVFARRRSGSYYAYDCDFNDENINGYEFTYSDIARIDRYGHHCAVNCEHLTESGIKHTVEVRIFRGTENVTTLYAALQFVINALKIANSDEAIIKYKEFLGGDYIAKYLEAQEAHGRAFSEADLNEIMSFIYADMHDDFIRLCSGTLDIDGFVESFSQHSSATNTEETSSEEGE